MCIQFIDRRSELKKLNSFWDRPEGAYVLWGRRRLGKTTLLRKFSDGKETIDGKKIKYIPLWRILLAKGS